MQAFIHCSQSILISCEWLQVYLDLSCKSGFKVINVDDKKWINFNRGKLTGLREKKKKNRFLQAMHCPTQYLLLTSNCRYFDIYPVRVNSK